VLKCTATSGFLFEGPDAPVDQVVPFFEYKRQPVLSFPIKTAECPTTLKLPANTIMSFPSGSITFIGLSIA
jgi:hypothetical protein